MTRLNHKVALCLSAVTLVLAGCASKGVNHAPVEERISRAGNPAGGGVAPATTPAAPVAAPVKQPQGFENAGKPGYYTVKPGDTLLRISMDNGQSMQDVARWSKVDNPNRIEVGQVLRVAPPSDGEGVVVKPVSKQTVVVATATAPASASSSVPKPAVADGDLNWLWPANGAVIAGFDEVKNKGLDIGGTAGEPVLAAADGRVVYVGAGLRGYGNLIILKHDNVFLTAYAHNQALLVKEDQSVTRGQKIAEMGNSDSDRVKLHFEVRRQGKPVDPAKYLPAR